MKNIFSQKNAALSVLAVISILIFSGCAGQNAQKSSTEQNQQMEQNKAQNQQQSGISAEDLKKPVVQSDIDEELKKIDKDLKEITVDDLNSNDLLENNL